MGTGGYLILLALAAIVSAQTLIMMARRKSLEKRLRNLNEGGDSFALLGVGILFGGALGAVVGSMFGKAGVGGAAGFAAGFLSWIVAVAWAHMGRQPPAQHREM
jgi:hypothetical protein